MSTPLVSSSDWLTGTPRFPPRDLTSTPSLPPYHLPASLPSDPPRSPCISRTPLFLSDYIPASHPASLTLFAPSRLIVAPSLPATFQPQSQTVFPPPPPPLHAYLAFLLPSLSSLRSLHLTTYTLPPSLPNTHTFPSPRLSLEVGLWFADCFRRIAIIILICG